MRTLARLRVDSAQWQAAVRCRRVRTVGWPLSGDVSAAPDIAIHCLEQVMDRHRQAPGMNA